MHEETFSLCGSLEAEDSPTKLQEYNRSYWSKNSSKLNQAKRRSRQVKKESELNGNVSPMFQAPAESPAKVSQQTVENLRRPSDNKSLPNSGLQENRVCNDEILRELSEIRGELLRQRDEIQSLVKPTAPAPKIVEKQASVSEIVITNGGNVTQEAEGNQAKKSCRDNGFDDKHTRNTA